MKSDFRIVNTFDKPCERLIAELREDGLLYYIHPDMLPEWESMGLSANESTSLEAFGLEVEVSEGNLIGRLTGPSTAQYKDGRPRRWQGSSEFIFMLP
jgi:hypothetical protein